MLSAGVDAEAFEHGQLSLAARHSVLVLRVQAVLKREKCPSGPVGTASASSVHAGSFSGETTQVFIRGSTLSMAETMKAVLPISHSFDGDDVAGEDVHLVVQAAHVEVRGAWGCSVHQLVGVGPRRRSSSAPAVDTPSTSAMMRATTVLVSSCPAIPRRSPGRRRPASAVGGPR